MSDTSGIGTIEDDRPGDAVAWIGRALAPIAAVAAYFLLAGSSLTDPARATASIGLLMAILWMSEALPLPATSLLPLALFPLAGATTLREAAAPYAHELIFLFMGGFMLALAMEKWGLHKRIALLVVLMVGTKPRRLIGGFMLASALLSMWISNSATAVMMMPIGAGVITLIEARLRDAQDPAAPAQETIDRFGVTLMLGLAYAASIGGVATIIGTPPNIVLVGYLKDNFDIEIGFVQWMMIGLPFSAVLLVFTWFLLTFILHPIRLTAIPGGRELIRSELRSLGPVSRGEWSVFIVFMLTASLWIFRQPVADLAWMRLHAPALSRLSDEGAAILAALLLFSIPVDRKRRQFALDWETAARLPWGVLLLFGGGLSLARAVTTTGLDIWIGAQAQSLGALPIVLLVAIVVTMVIFLTELTSNTATATTFLPILGGVAAGVGVEAPTLVIPAAIAASCAFMMPVATPPNAIVFASGRVRIGQMVRAGFVLNITAIVIITLLAFTVERWALQF